MIIASVSYKGGCGKSTLAQNLAVCMAHTGSSVTIVDADATQASIKWAATRYEQELEPAIKVIGMTDAKAIAGVVLQEQLDRDYVIIDGPPSLQPVVNRIFAVSDVVIMPITPSGGSDMWVTKEFLDRFQIAQEEKGKTIPAYFLVNRYKANVGLHNAFITLLEEYEQEYEVGILKTRFYDRIAFGEANAQGMGVVEWNTGKAGEEVVALNNEVIEICNNL